MVGFDGGGVWVGSNDYEVAAIANMEGDIVTFYQKDVKEVIIDQTGKETYDWGNAFYPGHPQDAEELLSEIEQMLKENT